MGTSTSREGGTNILFYQLSLKLHVNEESWTEKGRVPGHPLNPSVEWWVHCLLVMDGEMMKRMKKLLCAENQVVVPVYHQVRNNIPKSMSSLNQETQQFYKMVADTGQ